MSADRIQAETRREALKTLQAALLGQLGADGPANTVWAYWGCPVDPAEEQTKGIKRVARELEAEVVKQSHTSADFRELPLADGSSSELTLTGESIASLCKALKLLRHPSVIEAICGGELAGDFGDGEAGGWMRLVERFARAEADRHDY